MTTVQMSGLPIALALSGEAPSRALLERFAGVGLVRGEYVFRGILRYPTEETAGAELERYLSSVCAATEASVAYRTLEVTQAEANVLEGVEHEDDEDGDDLLGLRGVRRHMAFPASLDAELRAVRRVRERHPNLEVVAPFVTSADEYVWFRERVRSVVGPDVVVGTMVETPAAAVDVADLVDAGCRRFVVGSNDLTSLLAARRRGPALREGSVPGLARLLAHVTAAVHAVDGTVDLAGYLTPTLVETAVAAGVDRGVVHYSDLARLGLVDPAALPDLGHLAAVKARTRDAIAARRSRISRHPV
ncbi:putative PEP-binding protein [Cellulomonas fimi]|uniref:putative PEP-binding protein n=1 Tax=Cellulomonas fimi TaxID=1708 RepID=UPI00059F2228|nr:putative PEP-binding protein [Cellulomonas fimi]NNH06653.1 hypothetical protein [Cellulomonas fimi]